MTTFSMLRWTLHCFPKALLSEGDILSPQALYIVKQTLLFSQGLSERDIIVCSGPYIVRETLLYLVCETLKETFLLSKGISK